MYKPTPIPTDGVQIPENLRNLSELIARNTHEVWSAGRIRQGWTWGPVRDDNLKQHPDIIPYEELPEEEKEYDRRTSMETVKLILALGYEIHEKT